MQTDLLDLSYTLADIDIAAQQFWAALQGYTIFAFSGEMGAGKTTFIHHLCEYLKVTDAVSSPTFALINEYHYNNTAGQDKTIYHMDWYRLRDTEEAINTGMEDCIIQAGLGEATCLIEWPEKAEALLPHPHLWISIIAVTPEQRQMTVTLR